MITFDDIINEKDKNKRNMLIDEKINELNSFSEPYMIDVSSIFNGFISSESKIFFSECH